MNRFALYNNLGVIDSIFIGSEESARDQGLDFLPCDSIVSDASHYVDVSGKHVIKPRESLGARPFSVGLLTNITGLAPGTRLVVEEMEAVVDSNSIEIEFDAPGTYEIRIYPPPQYLDETLEVTVG